MAGMLTCLTDALEANDAPVAHTALWWGPEVVHDDCCDGMAYVRLAQVYPTAGQNSGAFPGQDTTHRNCGINALSARLAVGVIRCAAKVDNQGNPPSAATITAETTQMTLDTSIALEAIMCCLPGVAGVQASMIDVWNPTNPDGGCVGGEWQVRVMVGHCGCP